MRTCLQNHPVAFIGDSRTRGLYYELVEAVSLNSVKDEGKAVSYSTDWLFLNSVPAMNFFK